MSIRKKKISAEEFWATSPLPHFPTSFLDQSVGHAVDL